MDVASTRLKTAIILPIMCNTSGGVFFFLRMLGRCGVAPKEGAEEDMSL